MARWPNWRTSQALRSKRTAVASGTRAVEACARVSIVVAVVAAVSAVGRRAVATVATVGPVASCTALPGVG